MKRSSPGWWLLIGVCCAITRDVAHAQSTPALRALDFVPVDVSRDGSVIAGHTDPPYPEVSTSFVWNSATGTKKEIGLLPSFTGPFPISDVASISADGSAVVGMACTQYWDDTFYGSAAFRWTAETGTVGLDTGWNRATGVSADGSVVVGNAYPTAGFRWTADAGMVLLSDVYRASAVSDDGTTVVGLRQVRGAADRTEAVRWREDEGATRLGTLPGDYGSEATDVSADGSVVVGVSHRQISANQWETRLFRWTAVDGMVDLGRVDPWQPPSVLSWADGSIIATSADGSIIVGNRSVQTGVEPFIWDDAHGIRSLHDALTGLRVDVGGWDLGEVRGISGDGRTFIGYGHDPSGNASGWIVTVPEPAGMLLVVLLAPALLHRHGRRHLTHSGTP